VINMLTGKGGSSGSKGDWSMRPVLDFMIGEWAVEQ
jgi:hypothetical protein